MTTSPQQPPPGLTVDGYQLLARLGEGGMGVVHLARRPGGERVALKVLRPHIVGGDEARQRLAREVGSLSRIRSRWVAEIVDADPWGPIPYVATRYVPGLSLHDQVRQDGPLAEADLRWLARCLAQGIASVHEVGVLHRDVKPSNVLMEGRTPILIDFGLARVADDPRLTHTGWLLGTPGYLAPEILHGDDATAAADVHSWAATVAFAGTGDPPFGRGPSMAVMDRVRRGEHRLEGLPSDLRGILEAALDPEPGRRPDLDTVLDWLEHGMTPPAAPLPVSDHSDDYSTVPLLIAAQGRQGAPSIFDEEPTEVAGGDTRYLEDDPLHETVKPPLVERARRFMVIALGGLATAAAVTAYPWLALASVTAVVWFLRSASLAASATVDRRRLRGVKWYDPVLYLLSSPWHVVRAIPGTAMLVLWSVGLGMAAALVAYAVATTLEVGLLVSGLVLVLALWLGPGGSRLRSPIGRIVNPLSRNPVACLVATLLLLTATGVLGYRITTSGVTWTPDDDRPFRSVTLP